MQEARYVIVEWSPTARLWIATSNDVSGLLTAAETYELLVSKLRVEIPELLKANGHLTDEQILDRPIHLIAHREDIILLRDSDNIVDLLEHAIAGNRKPSTSRLN